MSTFISDPYQPIEVESSYPPPKASIDPDKEKGWMKRLLPLVKSHPWISVVGIFFGILTLVSQVGVPYVSRLAIDAAEANDTSNLRQGIIILSIIAVVRAIAGILHRSAFYKLAFNIDKDLRYLLYRHLTKLSFAFYDRTVSGEVVSRANSDIRSVQILFAFAPLGITAFLVFVLALILMLTIHVLLTLVALVTIPFVYYLGNKFRDIVFPLSWVTQSRLAEVATIVDENTNGAHVVKAFSAEKEQVRLLAKTAKRVRWSVMETINTRARYNPAIEALPKLGMAAVLLYGGWLVIEDQVSIGTLFAFSAYVVMSLVPFRMLGFLIIQARRSAAAAERIYEILDTPIDVEDSPNAVHLENPSGRIQFEDVHFNYPTPGSQHLNGEAGSLNGGEGNKEILSGVSFSVEPGETIAVVGSTGSGKSTIARLLARFYDTNAGAIFVDNLDVKDLTQTSLHHHICIVFDDPFLFSTSLADNIAFTKPGASIEEIHTAAKSAQAHNFIMNLPDGYETIVGERGYTLSGGQRQRVALARVFLAKPSILVLDDATSAVDVETESLIHNSIKQQTSTILVIAHRLSTIALADRVLLLDDGQITDSGLHKEMLTSNPRYREILAEVTQATSDASNTSGASNTSDSSKIGEGT